MSDAENKQLTTDPNALTETDGSGRADETECLAHEARIEAVEAGRAIAAKFASLSLKQRQQLATAFRGGLIQNALRAKGRRRK